MVREMLEKKTTQDKGVGIPTWLIFLGIAVLVVVDFIFFGGTLTRLLLFMFFRGGGGGGGGSGGSRGGGGSSGGGGAGRGREHVFLETAHIFAWIIRKAQSIITVKFWWADPFSAFSSMDKVFFYLYHGG